MTRAKIYHNPKCSKSRQTLALLKAHKVDAEIILYLQTPPDRNQLREIITALNIPTRDLIRTGEQEYRELNLAALANDEPALIDAMVAHPKLIQRPIVVIGKDAVLGRPPENVLSLL